MEESLIDMTQLFGERVQNAYVKWKQSQTMDNFDSLMDAIPMKDPITGQNINKTLFNTIGCAQNQAQLNLQFNYPYEDINREDIYRYIWRDVYHFFYEQFKSGKAVPCCLLERKMQRASAK
jgi:hypothetical protein